MGQTASSAQPQDEMFSYDEVLYESFSYGHTHPQNLALIGRLFGMKPAEAATARVLELGCAMGGNLFPLACRYPEGRFLGIDLSKAQIDAARKDAKALNLKNITFEQMDINDFPANAGEFDYIICHGIYSWVPEGVQDSIFNILQRHLAPQGLAHISYNCLPGWHFVKALREMMLFHTARFSNPKDKITQARAFLDFVHDNTSASNTAYKQVIDMERQNLKKANDSYLFHDHLEGVNTPFYLHEVVSKAASKGIQYVGDTSVASMFVGNLPKEAAEKLGTLNNIVLQEQYIDFLNNRRFRNSVFAKADVPLNRAIHSDMVLDLTVRALFQPEEGTQDINQNMRFLRKEPAGSFDINDKAGAALFLTMAAHTKPLPVRELVRRAAEAHKIEPAVLEEAAVKNLMPLFFANFVQFFTDCPQSAETLSDKPKLYKLALHQAGIAASPVITNMIGEGLAANAHEKEILRLADGSRTVDDIVEEFGAYIEKNNHTINSNGAPVTDPAARAEAVRSLALDVLNRFVRSCAFVG